MSIFSEIHFKKFSKTTYINKICYHFVCNKYAKSVAKVGYSGLGISLLLAQIALINGNLLRLNQIFLSNIENSYLEVASLALSTSENYQTSPNVCNITYKNIIQYLNQWYFYEVSETNICNFADDTTPHASGDVLKDVMIQLEHGSNTLLDWFRDNFMTLCEGKCHLLVCGHKH